MGPRSVTGKMLATHPPWVTFDLERKTLNDFRIVLPPDLEFSDRELDWVEESQSWRLSDKELGSVKWFFDREPRTADLERLREFFEIPADVPVNELARLSPGELAVLHAQKSDPAYVRAARSPDGSKHWIVFKRFDGAWLKYGRKCDGGWWLGAEVSDDTGIGPDAD